MTKKLRRQVLGAFVVLLLGTSWFVLTNVNKSPDFPDLTVGALEAQPIFTNLAKNHLRLLRKARKKGGFSETPGRINWAPDIYEAIETARAEDKPVFLVTFCRENCDQNRDV